MSLARVDKPPDLWPFWDCLDDETRGRFLELMPAGWQPGRKPYLESTEEIGRIIRRKPQYPGEFYRS